MNPETLTPPELLTAEEACSYLRLTKNGLYKLVQRDGLPAERLGREYRFRRSELDAWLKRHQPQAAVDSSAA